MNEVSRRDILRAGLALAAGFGLGGGVARAFARGIEKLFDQQQRVLWLQAQSCSGCSVSTLNTEAPDILDVLTRLSSLMFHPTLSAAQGDVARDAIRDAGAAGGYVLVIEGSIPVGMPAACVVGEQDLATELPAMIRSAAYVVAIGSCATFGGVPAAEGAETGAVSVMEFMQQRGLPTERRLINLPGCPIHPESLVGTLAYVTAKGYPDVVAETLAPQMFFRNSVHDDCPLFHHWQKREFAQSFGEAGCLFKLGCLGPLSHTNCSRRQWNGGVNWCIRAGAPCNACTSPTFARKRNFPFYRVGEKLHPVHYNEHDRSGETH